MNQKFDLQAGWLAVLLTLGVGGAVSVAEADDVAPDKSRYHFFNPTPRDQMRVVPGIDVSA